MVWGTGSAATIQYPNGEYATHAQLYSSAGTPIGGTLLVSGNNHPLSVAMNGSGFDVLYIAMNKKSTENTPTVQRYSYTSSKDSAVGKPIEPSGGDTIAMDGAGDFVVVWQDKDSGNSQQIDAQLFSNAGSSAGTIQVSPAVPSGTGGVNSENVAMDSAGYFVVDWRYSASGADFLYARQFTPGGTPEQAETNPIIVAQEQFDSSGNETADPVTGGVAAETGGGAFDISWTNRAYPDQLNIEAAAYDSSANQLQTFDVTALTSSPVNVGPSIAVDANNDLFVVWQQFDVPNTDTGNIEGEFFLDPPAPAPTTSASTSSSPTAAATPGGSTTAATDAVFAAYAYPDDDDTLG